jgi:small ligand-binding sensory domain FIST
MRWLSALSEKGDIHKAVEECAVKLRDGESSPPDLLFAFPSPHFAEHYEKLPELLKKAIGTERIVGCSGGGIIGGGKEVEHKRALSLVAAWLPGVAMRTFHVTQENMPSPDAPPNAWREWTGVPVEAADKIPSFIVLSDPFSVNAEEFAQGLDFAYPGAVKIGGLASGAMQPGGNALFQGLRRYDRGAVGVSFTGNVVLDPIVAQGCRPIGVPLQITKCERNLLIELDEKRTLDVLETLIEGLSEEDQELAKTSLFIGVVNDATKADPSKRDYLIRNLVGLDPKNGVLAVGAFLRPGQTVQFHLRDRRTSAEDLKDRLARYRKKDQPARPQGALLFSCLGRGENLYREPNHDTDAFLEEFGSVPVGGFFCNGEIGPVDGSTYLHGFTSCFGIFRPMETKT